MQPQQRRSPAVRSDHDGHQIAHHEDGQRDDRRVGQGVDDGLPEGRILEDEMVADTALARMCSAAFEAIWDRAIPHAAYRLS